MDPADVILEVNKISPQEGDIVVLTTTATHPDNIQDIMSKVGKPLMSFLQERKCMILVLPAGMELSALNENLMRDNGWVKKPKILVG